MSLYNIFSYLLFDLNEIRLIIFVSTLYLSRDTLKLAMGAIVSTKKKVQKNSEQIRKKTLAVSALSTQNLACQNGKSEETESVEHLSAVNRKNENETSAPMQASVAVASWGEGVIGTSEHELHQTGQVTSRGIDKDVESSASLYTDFARVTSPRIISDDEAAVKIQSQFRAHRARKEFLERKESTLKIQKCVRGYQARTSLKLENESAAKIQRHFRNILEKQKSKQRLNIIQENEGDNQEKPWNRRLTPTLPIREMTISGKTKESFDQYQDDITELKWKSEQQIERTTLGDDYVPQKILLIASNIPKSELLASVTLNSVHVCLYNFAEMDLDGLYEQIMDSLNDYRSGSKARRIGLICQGGPGHIYLTKGIVVTVQKLEKHDFVRDFFKKLSNCMSKLDANDAKIQILGNNNVGKKAAAKHEKLIVSISKLMKPNKVIVESPTEFMIEGWSMLEEYFDIEKYKVWKRTRHSKVSDIKL